MQKKKVSNCPYTRDLFGDLIIPLELNHVCYSIVPNLKNISSVCLTGYFDCARGNIKRVKAMQKILDSLNISVTENWNNNIDLLIVGNRAKMVILKIKNAVKLGIPIVKESDLIENVRFFKL